METVKKKAQKINKKLKGGELEIKLKYSEDEDYEGGAQKKPYCGASEIPKNKKKGTMIECSNAKQIRLYGLNKIDKRLLKAKKEKKMTRDQLIMKRIQLNARIKQFKKQQKDVKKLEEEVKDLEDRLKAIKK